MWEQFWRTSEFTPLFIVFAILLAGFTMFTTNTVIRKNPELTVFMFMWSGIVGLISGFAGRVFGYW